MARGKFYTVDGAEARFADSGELAAVDGKAARAVSAATDALARTIRVQTKTEELATRVDALEGGAGLAGLLPAPASGVVGFIGDSWMTPNAGGAQGAGDGFTMEAAAAAHLGVAAAVSGQGSTGWGRPNGTAKPFEDPTRVDAVLDANPCLLVVVGSVNNNWTIDEDPTGGEKTISGAVEALVSRVRNRAPALPILVIGPQPTSEYRSYAGATHKNVRAVKAGVQAAGGAANGVWFDDWIGVADSSAVKWPGPARHWNPGEVISYDGVDYKVTSAWQPAGPADTPYAASLRPDPPVQRASVVLTGVGAIGKTPATGTRALWLLADETHVNRGGAAAFGAELAARIMAGAAALSAWAKSRGPVVVAPYTPPAPVRPAGRAADVRETRWATKWGGLSVDSLRAVLAQTPPDAAPPFSLALPVRMSKDDRDDRFVVSSPYRIVPKAGGPGPTINQSTIAELKAVEGVNGVIATLGEALDVLDAAPARGPIIVECMDTTNDTIADYWVYDQKMMQFLIARVGGGDAAKAAKRVIVVTGPTLNAARAKAKADPALSLLTRLVVKPSGPWEPDTINGLKDVGAIACRAADAPRPAVLAAIKNHPDKPDLWWAGMTTAADVQAARTAARTAGLPIAGWLAEDRNAAPEIATRTQPEE